MKPNGCDPASETGAEQLGRTREPVRGALLELAESSRNKFERDALRAAQITEIVLTNGRVEGS
jgi:hypothetical protein